MSDISPVTNAPLGVVAPSRDHGIRTESHSDGNTVDRGRDRVEVSEAAMYLSKLRDLPVRQDLVDSARQRLASEAYESSEAIEAAIDGLIDDLFA